MSHSPDAVVAALSEGLPTADLELVIEHDPRWLAVFPGGFAPVNSASEPGRARLRIHPDTIVAVGAELSEAKFASFVEAIHVWQHNSAMHLMLGMPADLVVATFNNNFPFHGAVLGVMARNNDLAAVDFMGANNKRGPHGT